MEQPKGCKVRGDYVCTLVKVMYGLKKSARLWHKQMKEKLLAMQFRQSLFDPCLFIYEDVNGRTVYIGLYVDDGLLIGNDDELMQEFLDCFENSF